MKKKILPLMMMLLLAFMGVAKAEIVEIGDGTSTTYYVPYNSLYEYSFTEMVYPASEIGTAGNITSISFYLGTANTSADQTNEYDLYMKNVSRETFESNTDFEPVTAGDLVFSGEWTIPMNYSGWLTINLDTPFSYDGTSNLMVAMHEKSSGYSTRYFTYTSVTNCGIQAYSDMVNPDPLDMDSYSGSKALRSYLPNIQLNITAGSGVSVPYEAQIGEGTGTSGYFPFYTLYNYSIGENLFLASELEAAGVLAGPVTSLSWYATNETGYEQQGISIWMANVSDTELTASSHVATNMTLVYTGNVTPAIGWNEFPCNAGNFAWDGTSNVLILCQRNDGNWNSTVNWQVTSTGFNSMSYKYQDSGAFDVTVSNTMTTSSNRANIIIKGASVNSSLVEAQLTIHDGEVTNSYVPVYGFYTDAYLKSEIVYPAAELSSMMGSDINSIKFYSSSTNINWNNANFQVFLTEVAETTINDYYGPGTVVYEGALSIDEYGEMLVNFTTPYHYNGGNLLIGVYNTVTGSYASCNWFGETVENASVQGYSYSGLDAVTTTQRNFLPKVTFDYTNDGNPYMTVYDGTETNYYVPAFVFYFDAFTKSQYVIPANDLIPMAGYDINSLTWYTTNNNVPYTTDVDVDIYMTEVNYTSISAYENRDNCETVYTGALSFEATSNGGKVTIDFDTPFHYVGGNLLIGCENQNEASYKLIYFYGQTVENASIAHYNYNIPDISPTARHFMPKTTFGLVEHEALPVNLVATPNPIEMGYRPNGAWMRPMSVNLFNEGDATFVNSVAVSNDYFQASIDEMEAPFVLRTNRDFNVTLNTSESVEAGSVNASLIVNCGTNEQALFDINAVAYDPVSPDVWELAEEVTEFPFTATLNAAELPLYDNYRIAPADVPDGADAVYKLVFTEDTYLNASITEGENGKVALYPEGFKGLGGPDLENAYQHPGLSIDEWLYYDNGEFNTNWLANSHQTMWGILFTPEQLGRYENSKLTKVALYEYISGYIITTKIYIGGDTPSNGTLVHTQDFETIGLDDYHEIELDQEIAIDPTQNLWITFRYDGSAYLASCAAFTGSDNGRWIRWGETSYWQMLNEGYTWMVRGFVTNQEGTVAIEDRNNREVEGITVTPGTYYLVASSTSDAFTVEINADEVPCPELAYNPAPANGATEITPNNVYLAWSLDSRATEFRLMFGTTADCEEVLVDWTRDLSEHHILTGLSNNTQYFWRVDQRNGDCRDGVNGDVWNFTTHLVIPEIWVDYEYVLEGDGNYLRWNPTAERGLLSYNIYQDSIFIGNTTDTYFDISYLTYNLAGYRFNVTAVYDEGESLYSNNIFVYVSGLGAVAGHVYEQDGVTPIQGAMVRFDGTGEFGGSYWYYWYPNEEGSYAFNLAAGTYTAYATANGYQQTYYLGDIYINYNETTSDIDFVLDEYFYPAADVHAAFYPDANDLESEAVKVTWSSVASLYDFEDGTLQGWTSVDVDEDGREWYTRQQSSIGAAHSGNYMASSWSWDGSAFDPDNWLISPELDGATLINYYVAINTGYPDHYALMVSSTGNAIEDFTTIFEETPAERSGVMGNKISSTEEGDRPMSSWLERSVELPAGTKYVAFRHFNSYDMNYLFLDDIAICKPWAANRSLQYYRVYRTDAYNDGPYTTENTVLVGDQITETSLIDYTWQDLASGVYKYGVSAVYEGNRESAISWINNGSNGLILAESTNGDVVMRSVAPQRNHGEIRNEELINEGFEEGIIPTGWATIDADGDGYDWMHGSALNITTGHNESTGLVLSQSYHNNAGALTPDNYLVTPQVALGGTISFWACAQDAVWAAEHFGVAVSTGSQDNPNDFVTITEWTLSAKGSRNNGGTRGGNRSQGAWYEYIVDLGAYAGQTGYVAIRHFNCTDQYYLNIDDVVVTGMDTPLQGDRESVIAWSNPLDKDMTTEVTLTVTLNSGDSPAGTAVYFYNLNGNEQNSHPMPSIVLDESGFYAWNDFRKGDYEIGIELEGYYYFYTWASIYEPTDLAYVLTEIMEYVNNPYVSSTGWAIWEGFGNDVNTLASGYTFIEDFEEGIPEGWTTIDANNDGFNWMFVGDYPYANYTNQGHNNSYGYAVSESYDNASYNAITPDNYLVSPQVRIVDGSTFSFWVTDGNDSWGAEHYGVAVSTTGNTDAADFTTIAEWTLLSKDGAHEGGTRQLNNGIWYQQTVDLSAYAGQSVYIAIRHFDCYDQWLLCVDDINLSIANSQDRHYEYTEVMLSDLEGVVLYSGETTNNYMQLPVDDLVEGQTYLFYVTNVYSSGQATNYVEWVYQPCDNYEGVSNLTLATTDEGNLISWEFIENAYYSIGGNSVSTKAQMLCLEGEAQGYVANVNAGYGESGPDYSCIYTAMNPSWFYLQIDNPGDIEIHMYSDPNNDIDFCCWGPFDDPLTPCPNGLTSDKVVDCSYSANWDETCHIPDTAQTGEYYILVLTNYSNQDCNFYFEKTNGSGTTNCSSYSTVTPKCMVYRDGELLGLVQSDRYLDEGVTDAHEYSIRVVYDGPAQLPTHNYYYSMSCPQVVEEPYETYEITATVNPEEAGFVAGAGVYRENAECTLTATAYEGYRFSGWTLNGATVSTSEAYTFTVTEDADFVANFSSTANYWEVDESAYAGNMTVTAVIQIDGIEQFRTDLELGAFCGDECRGTMRPTDEYYDPEWMPHYYLFLTVHGDNGDQITFRLYDHSLNQELDLECANILTFTDNAMIGDIEPPYAINFMNALTQTTNFRTGWNWWSSYVDLTEINGLAALEEGLGSAGVQIKSQSKFVINYGTTWLGGLNAINNEQTLKVQTNAPVTVDLTSKPVSPADHPLTLNAGWNWIGYPCTNSMSLTQAFANYTPSNGDQVKTQSSYAIYRAGIGWMGALQTLTPGNGLFFYTSTGGTLVFSDGSRNNNAELAENITADNNHWVPDMSAYPSNMTVTAVVEMEDVELQSERYELAAFANGEVRGSARLMYIEPMDRYMAFLTVTGDEAAELHFGLYDTETGTECIESDNLLVFTADAMVGELESPMVVSFRGTTGLSDLERSLQVYPNPVKRGERAILTLPVDAKAQVEVVNALGVVVETLRATSVQAPASPGVYTLRITVDGKGTISRKLVVR